LQSTVLRSGGSLRLSGRSVRSRFCQSAPPPHPPLVIFSSMEQPTTYYAFLCQIIPSRRCYTVLVSPRLQKVWHRVPCTGDKNIPMMKALEIKSCSSVLISTGFFRL
jgi:hypothetical protein